MHDFNIDTVIETDRLKLRYLKIDDTKDIFTNVNSDKLVLEYFVDRYVDDVSIMTLDRTINYCVNEGRYLFGIELKETHEVIGMILECSSPNPIFKTVEVGYAIGRKFWNQGYTTEALDAMINFLFSIGVHKVEASYIIGNNASRRVMEKCGMIYECKKIDEIYYHNTYHDTEYYYIINKK